MCIMYQFFFLSGESCKFCKETCLKCISKDICQRCVSGMYDALIMCTTCNKNIPIDSKCQCGTNLIANCAQCDFDDCIKCSNNYKLVNGVCLPDQCQTDSQCSNLQFCDISTTQINVCKQCSKICKTCSNIETSCTSCNIDQFLYNNACSPCNTAAIVGFQCYCQNMVIENCSKCGAVGWQSCLMPRRLIDGECINGLISPEDCQIVVSTNIIIYIVVGVISASILVIGIVIITLVMKRRKLRSLLEMNIDALGKKNNSSTLLF
ncbi:Cysteine-rich membrane protein 2 [Spironucleus salmonicida]|uniref:Cysteine-rich membrane protein 2 n=1 Tax=Spironucleus salmonicida TaxID=348837 RepID=A0A9P8RUQ4_9EUKA|nr:Cysteine-rich membrane protein 2 [Spironucleus salmonicida]